MRPSPRALVITVIAAVALGSAISANAATGFGGATVDAQVLQAACAKGAWNAHTGRCLRHFQHGGIGLIVDQAAIAGIDEA